jgi:hypothetical protein
VLDLGKIVSVTPQGKKEFNIDYDGVRTFELQASNGSERDTWIQCIIFLRDIKEKMGSQLDSFRTQSEAAYFDEGSFASNRNASGSFSNKQDWRISNLDKESILGVIDEEDKAQDSGNDNNLSEIALERKGILTHIEEIPLEVRKSRVMYGFLKKAGRGKLSIDHDRWCFIISSRPLNKTNYLNDDEQISDDYLPPLIEFDSVYYYEMRGKDDSSPCKGVIKCTEINKINLKTEGKFHTLMIDAGKKKYELMSSTKYIVQQWMEAMDLAKRTANEMMYSITGTIK